MRTIFHVKIWGWAALFALAGLPSVASAQGISLSVGNTVPVVDVFSRNWPGTDGNPDGSCPVEIRRTWTGGLILAPSNDPVQLDALNPLITNSYLGRGVVGTDPGIYAETFTNHSVLATNLQYYARVFDRPASQPPLYYADTLPFFGPPADVPSINPEFGDVKLVATGAADVDTDGDGIPDEMESYMGTVDPNNPDTDGDGYNDWFETFWSDYLTPDGADVPLVVQINSPDVPGTEPRTVSWETIAVPGMTYQLQYRPWWQDEEGYSNVWSVVATDSNVEYDVESLIQTDSPVKGFFRVIIP